MLSPHNRRTLVEALTPPADYEFDSAMAVTYSLDLRALLEVPMALAGMFGDDRIDDPETEQQGTPAGTPSKRSVSVPLLAALKQHAGNITVFAQAGQLAVPESRLAFSFLEDCVVPVTAPKGGVVHAKIWALGYRPSEGQSGETHVRIVTGSRNLTRDRSWDVVARFDAVCDGRNPRGTHTAPLDGVADLFEALLEPSRHPPGDSHRKRVESLAAVVRRSKFLLPAGVRDASVHLLGTKATGGSAKFAFPRDPEPERSLVVSPFLKKTFFERTLPGTDTELISRGDALEAIDLTDMQRDHHISRAFTLHGDAAGHEIADPTDGELGNTNPADDPRIRLTDLHAKAYLFDLPKGHSQFWFGSANATNAAFSKNVEVLFKLEGRTDDLGIDALIGDPEEARKVVKAQSSERGRQARANSREARTLRELLVPYVQTGSDLQSPDPAAERLEHLLDRARRTVGELRVRAIVTEAATGVRFDVRYRSAKHVTLPRDEDFAPDWRVTCHPHMLGEADQRDVEQGQPLDITFRDVSLEEISLLLVVRVTALGTETAEVPGSADSTATYIPVHEIKWPTGLEERRDTAIMRDLIGDGKRFLRYLLAMLSGRPEQANVTAELVEASGLVGGSTEARRRTTSLLPALEPLLKTLRTQPQRLLGMQPLVQSILADMETEGASKFDGFKLDDFKDLWNTVIELAQPHADSKGDQT